jgi:hypothetical protein
VFDRQADGRGVEAGRTAPLAACTPRTAAGVIEAGVKRASQLCFWRELMAGLGAFFWPGEIVGEIVGERVWERVWR